MSIYKIRFYAFLIWKKSRTKLHNLFESKCGNTNPQSPDDLKFFLFKYILSKLTNTEHGIYFNTKIKNNGSPMTLAQARVLLGFCILHEKNQVNFYTKYLIENLKEYLISLKDENGLYKFNQVKWNLQDEGVATIWTLLALLQVYKISQESKLLDEIVSTVNIMNKKLVDSNNSLLHNLGDQHWCLNTAATYALFASRLSRYYKNDEIINNYITAIELCVSKINSEGFFPYAENRSGTYLLLYNPVVIYMLENAINGKIISKELKLKTEEAIAKARQFLLKQMDENNFFVEPEQKKFSRYIISNVTSLVVLKNKVSKELENSILTNISSYLNNNKLYLCRNSNGQYFDGNLYEVSDVLATEVFYWFLVYLLDES